MLFLGGVPCISILRLKECVTFDLCYHSILIAKIFAFVGSMLQISTLVLSFS